MSREDISLGRRMAEAARLATEAAMAAGHGRGDPITVASAKKAADDVYLAERGIHEVPWYLRKPDAQADPRAERMERD